MNVQIISDLHLEIGYNAAMEPVIVPVMPVLAVLGDVGNPYDANYSVFLEKQAGKFEMVFVILGNHEYYGNEYLATKEQARKVCSKFDNVVLLDKESYLYNGVRVLGCTLWSHVPEDCATDVSKLINDYNQITCGDRICTVDDTNRWHSEELEWLATEISRAKDVGENVCVLTHHAPLAKGTSHSTLEIRPSCTAFATDLSYLMGGNVKLWCFGHTHYTTRIDYNGTIVASNQFGYKFMWEDSGYDSRGVHFSIE